MPPKKKKMNLTVDLDAQDENLAASVYSEIGPDGLRFLKHDIRVSQQGVIHDKYQNDFQLSQIIENGPQIGSGAASCVVQGYYQPMDKQVAIKKINVYDREKRHQLMNDIRTLLQNKIKAQREGTNCEFFVDLYGAFYQEGVVKVVLELMDVGSLADLIKLLKGCGQTINEVILAKIAQQILNALAYLHVVNNHVHRDIKPANILMNSNGEVKITDFGILKELENQEQFCQTFVGTKAYMSPERIKAKPYCHKSDIWSFGLIMYELATLSYPYPDNDSPTLPENFTEQFQDFLSQCLVKNQNQRASAVELLAHPWILTYFGEDIEICDWLESIKKSMPKTVSQQRSQQKKVSTLDNHENVKIKSFDHEQFLRHDKLNSHGDSRKKGINPFATKEVNPFQKEVNPFTFQQFK